APRHRHPATRPLAPPQSAPYFDPVMGPPDRVMLFDVDGTLVDSNDAHARAWVETLSTFGIERDLAAARRLIGMGGDKLLPTLTGISADGDLGREISKQRSKHFKGTYRDGLR